MITYCTNIHPGESWEATFHHLRENIPVIRTAVSPQDRFPIGLRLSNRATLEVDERASREFMEWLEVNRAFVPTLNGFPYGTFHGPPLKEAVYLPDWRDMERMEYTNRLATLLDRWLPDDEAGSISTLPVALTRHLDREDVSLVGRHLRRSLEHLDQLRQGSGKKILLCLEPEPGCFLATTEDAADLIDRLDYPDSMRQMIGVCFDCCHEAVEFQEPGISIQRLMERGIAVGKVQVSSALRLTDPDESALAPFSEPCYLHQTVIRNREGVVQRYRDLPDALRAHSGKPGDEWRVHFHLPIFWGGDAGVGTTASFITELLPFIEDDMLLEIETYTWEVLPPELKTATMAESIIREIVWLKGELRAAHRRP